MMIPESRAIKIIHAVNVNGSDKVINGVTFKGESGLSGTGWQITGGFSTLHSSTPSTVTGSMGESLSNGFRYNGTSQKIKMTGLIPGENYTFSLYSQAWGSERNCTLSCDALSQIITVNQICITPVHRMGSWWNVHIVHLELR